MPKPRRSVLAPLAIASLVLLGACSDAAGPDEDPVTREEITRSFTADTLTTTEGGTTTDRLAEGAELDITLHDDGTTTGRLFAPGGQEDGSDLEADLAGTFTFDPATGQVVFDQDADTFVRNVMFEAVRYADGVRLVGQRTFFGVTVRAVLK